MFSVVRPIKNHIKRLIKKNYPFLNPLYSFYLWKIKGDVGCIFCLHRVGTKNALNLPPNENMKISPLFLDKLIKEYQRRNIDIISLDELYSIFNNDNGKPQRPFVCFTLDDGYVDNYTEAYEVFKRNNVPFTIYIASDFPDGKAFLWWYCLEDIIQANDVLRLSDGKVYNTASSQEKIDTFMAIRRQLLSISSSELEAYFDNIFSNYEYDKYKYVKKESLSWNQIEELAKDSLCTIAGHSVSHPAFNQLTESAFYDEVKIGCDRLATHINKPIAHFAYPYGTINEVGEREHKLMRKLGFKTVAITDPYCIKGKNMDLLKLPRIMLVEDKQI